MKYDLGFFDQDLGTVTSAENPFGAKVTDVPGTDLDFVVRPDGFEPPTPWFEEPYSKQRKIEKTRRFGISVVLRNRRLPLDTPLKL